MNARLVVIGSNSFSGSHFVDLALKDGLTVVGMSRSEEPSSVFLPYKMNSRQSAYRFYKLDLNHDIHRMMDIMLDFQPEYVVNFAAQSMVGESWECPEHWFQTNVVASVKLHNELRTLSFLKTYVHVSTPEVYGTCEGLVKEGTIYHPSTPYAVSRAAADMSLMSFHKAYGFPVVFTRAANVYGPGQQLYRIVPRTIFFFMIGKKLQLHGGGQSVRSFIHARDVADGTLKVARHGERGGIYHFSTRSSLSIRTLVELIAGKMNIALEESVEVVDDRLGKDPAYLLDSTKVREELGWRDEIGLEEGIEETIAWVTDNLEVLKAQPRNYVHKP